MDEPNEQKLKAAIDAAIEQSEGQSVSAIAANVLKTQPELVAAMTPHWQRTAVEAMVRHRLRRIDAANSKASPDQMALPFADLSIRLPVRTGKIELRTATMGKLRGTERYLMKQLKESIKNPRTNSLLAKVRREIDIVAPYAYANRKITVEKVHELIAAGVPAPEPTRGMSAAMKRYWDSKSPEERSAIARRRARKRYSKKKT